MSKLHLVFGGRVADPQGLDFLAGRPVSAIVNPDYRAAGAPS